ncbi:DUF4190 domain-containing protein [Microbacterium timonense]|jgi:hypothetical protein|uniref:DUF4190 domain-containing protein n=1 Tax=Microbacterium timonense TaxID=2086576 RepID=UPI000D10AA91|nr:DUF4190 domain-containing protein [Microbacterium timonense]
MTDPQNPADPAQQPPANVPPPPADAAYSGAPAAAPAYGAAPPAPYGAPAAAPVPGKTLGIVAFILSFFIQLVALILGIVALVQSRKAGHKNGWAVAAIIISAVLMILGIILFFAIVLPLLTFSGEVLQACQAVDFSGTVEVRGLPVDCSSVSN